MTLDFSRVEPGTLVTLENGDRAKFLHYCPEAAGLCCTFLLLDEQRLMASYVDGNTPPGGMPKVVSVDGVLDLSLCKVGDGVVYRNGEKGIIIDTTKPGGIVTYFDGSLSQHNKNGLYSGSNRDRCVWDIVLVIPREVFELQEK